MPRLLLAALLLATPLAAQTLTEQSAPVRALLQAVSPVDQQVVWVSGHRASVLRTVDGGATWTALRVVTGADTTLQFRDIHAVSRDQAWVLSAGSGAASRIYHTRDGGVTWTRQFMARDSAAFFDCFTFFTDRIGVAFGDAVGGRSQVLRTTDGGATWALLPADAVPAPAEGEGAFASSGGCVTNSDDRHGWIALGSPAAHVWRTDDAGATWTAVGSSPILAGASAGNAAASFSDSAHGMIVGGDIGSYRSDTTSAAVALTRDGGRTWTLAARPPRPGTPFGVAWVPELAGTALIASPGGLALSRDAGTTWQTVDPGVFWSVAATGRTAWAVGQRGRDGRILRLDF